MNHAPIYIVNPHVSNDGHVMLPEAWNQATGQVVVCEFKRSGQVMASESYECIEQRMWDGEILKHWRHVRPIEPVGGVGHNADRLQAFGLTGAD